MLHLLSSIGHGKHYFSIIGIAFVCIIGRQTTDATRCMIVSSSDACYYIHEGSDTWWQAASKCNSKEGHLVEFHYDREFMQVKKQIGEKHEGIYYIGLVSLGGTSPWFWYTTGKVINFSRDSEDADSARCMAIDFRYKPEGTLKPISCDEKLGYICESPEKAILVKARSSLLFEE